MCDVCYYEQVKPNFGCDTLIFIGIICDLILLWRVTCQIEIKRRVMINYRKDTRLW